MHVVQTLGSYIPWVLSGTSLATISYGLFTTLSPTTVVGNWIGYQIIGGVGNGAAASGVPARFIFLMNIQEKKTDQF